MLLPWITNMENKIRKMSQSEVETTRPFRSVKEAAAAFGKREMTILPSSPEKFNSITEPGSGSRIPNPKPVIDELSVTDSVRKLEMELLEIRQDLAHMKKRRSEMEIAFASINAQFHKSLSKLAELEASQAGERSGSRQTWEDQNEYLPCFGDALSIGETERKVQKEKSFIGGLFKKKSHSEDVDCSYPESIYSVLS